MNIHFQRLTLLRAEMQRAGIDAYIIPMADPHLSEYLPSFWKSIEWLSGFSGSAGTLLITQQEAMLWSDGRYWLQAEKQLENSGFILKKTTKTSTFTPHLLSLLTSGQVVGIDGAIFDVQSKQSLQTQLEKKGIILDTRFDLISKIWHERPPLSKEQIFEHHIDFAIQTREEKLTLIRQSLQECNATHHLISSLDDIAWITNLRGSDIECNPVFLSYLLIDHAQATLFIQDGTLSSELIHSLNQSQIFIKDYQEIQNELKSLKDATLLIDPDRTTVAMLDCLCKEVQILQASNPSLFLKSRKTPKQIAHIKKAMEQDGVALCHLQFWLLNSLQKGKKLSELDISQKLHSLRAENPLFFADSFHAIVGFGSNGAQCHYRATEESFSYITDEGFLLLDSGGNYLNGTTDITRVFPIGKVSKEQKRDYTLVLKAHIAMSSSIFPEDIAMPLLDSITRSPLWRHHLDYAHGTGHGVGYFLNVHEGPQVLSYYAQALEKTKAKEGMILSIEPGIYREGKWGVRLENLVFITQDAGEEEFGKFLRFETLSLYPFERECLELELLSTEEIRWIDSYHQEVYTRLSPHLDEELRRWLEQKCKSLQSP